MIILPGVSRLFDFVAICQSDMPPQMPLMKHGRPLLDPFNRATHAQRPIHYITILGTPPEQILIVTSDLKEERPVSCLNPTCACAIAQAAAGAQGLECL